MATALIRRTDELQEAEDMEDDNSGEEYLVMMWKLMTMVKLNLLLLMKVIKLLVVVPIQILL